MAVLDVNTLETIRDEAETGERPDLDDAGALPRVEELVCFVEEAGRITVQHDTLYNELRRWQ